MKRNRLHFTVLALLLLSQGCNYFKAQSVEPLLIINPPIIDFSQVGQSASMWIEIRNNLRERILIDTILVNVPGVRVGGRTQLAIDSMRLQYVPLYFEWDKYNNAPEPRLTIRSLDTRVGDVSVPILLPTSHREQKLTGLPGVYSRTLHRPVKFSGNGLQILFNAFTLPEPYHPSPDSQRIEVYTMNLLGENRQRITYTYNRGNSYGVDITDGGTRVLYYTDRPNGSRNMYIWTEGGTTDTLTNDTAVNTPVAFSPDARRVLFTSNRAAGNVDAYYMELPSKRLVRLTENANAEHAVCWSADGTRVLIRSVINGQSEILLSTLIGQPLRLTNNQVNDVPVAFSPDGNRILFFSERNARREIYTMALNGTDVLQLTNNQVLDYPVRYFPDGLRILYWSMDFNNNAEIYSIETKGGLQSIRRVTAIPWPNYPVDISRDGNLVLYYSEREPGFKGSDIFTIRL